MAGYLGLIKEKKKSKKSSTSKASESNLNELAKMFAATGGVIQ